MDTLLEKKYRGKGAELFRELEQEFAQRRNADRPRAEPRPQQQVRTPFPFIRAYSAMVTHVRRSPPYTIAF